MKKENTMVHFPVKVGRERDLLQFNDKNAIAKKLFAFLAEERGLSEADMTLRTGDGNVLLAFPDSGSRAEAEPSVLNQNPGGSFDGAEFVITAGQDAGKAREIESLAESFSMLMSLFCHNERVRDFIFQGLDSLPNSIHMYDNKLRLIYANSDFCAYAHIKDRDSAYGRPIDDILKEVGTRFVSIKNPGGDLKVKEVLKYGRPVVDWEVEVKSGTNANEYMFASNDIYPLHDSQGNISGVVEISRSRSKQLKQLRKALGLVADYTFSDIIGDSKPMVEAKQLAMSFAVSPYNILIYGESGVGKELFAQSIHNYSPRRKEPFVAINCASISPELIDSELFGYESGAFTGASKKGHVGKFELANGGTLFLDEVAELPLSAQTKLLRVLETGQISRIGSTKNVAVDVRVIAATNRSLEKMIDEGLFREDLYYRLMVLNITIPPLRERRGDILPCSEFFLGQAMRINNFGEKTLDADAKRLILDYDWPGNVRELRNVINRVYVLSSSSVITRDALLSSLQSGRFGEQLPVIDEDPEVRLARRRDAVEQSQAELLREALLITGGNKTKAAELLGVSRKTFYNMWERYKAFLP